MAMAVVSGVLAVGLALLIRTVVRYQILRVCFAAVPFDWPTDRLALRIRQLSAAMRCAHSEGASLPVDW